MRRDVYIRACDNLGLQIEDLDEEGHLSKIIKGTQSFTTAFSTWPPLNTYSAYVIAKDKIFTKIILEKYGIVTPRGEYVFVSGKGDWKPKHHKIRDVQAVAERLGYPLFVKPHDRSRGSAARIAHSQSELDEALQDVVAWSHAALLEEVQKGREGRLMCIDGEPVFLYYRKPNPITHIGNLAAGGSITDIVTTNIPNHISDVGRKVFRAFEGGLRLYAVDFFEGDDGNIVVLEVNARPHISGIYEYGSPEMASAVMEHALQAYFKNAAL